MCLKYSDCVPYFFFLFPFTCGIPGYSILGAFLVLLCKSKRYTSSQFLPFLVVTILEFMSEGLTADGARISGMISFLTFTAVFFYFLNDRLSNNYDITKAVKCYIWGTVACIVIIYYNMISFYGLPYLLSGVARSGALGIEGNDTSEMKGHIAMNANTIAYIAVCAFTSVIVMLPQMRKRTFAFICVSIIFLGGVLSFSRAYIICIALFGALYFLCSSGKGKVWFTLAVGVVCIAVLFFATAYYDAIFSVFSNRAGEASFATAGGRTLLFSEYQEKWSSNMFYVLFGCGVVDYYPLLKCHNAMHSGLQQIWVCLGVAGLTLFVYQIGAYLYRNIQRKHLIYCLPFLLTTIFDQSVQFLNPYPLMLPILVSLLVIKVPKQLKRLR